MTATFTDFSYTRRMIAEGNFKRAYDSLSGLDDRTSEWFYLRGLAAMRLGYYEEGEDYLKRAKFMEPGNREYQNAYDQYIYARSGYNNRADYYNRSRNGLYNAGCCCCGGNCCDTCCKLWCLDTMCECCGGDLISCC